jgi:hypothetical protein
MNDPTLASWNPRNWVSILWQFIFHWPVEQFGGKIWIWMGIDKQQYLLTAMGSSLSLWRTTFFFLLEGFKLTFHFLKCSPSFKEKQNPVWS